VQAIVLDPGGEDIEPGEATEAAVLDACGEPRWDDRGE
jgi:hypothetical protein